MDTHVPPFRQEPPPPSIPALLRALWRAVVRKIRT